MTFRPFITCMERSKPSLNVCHFKRLVAFQDRFIGLQLVNLVACCGGRKRDCLKDSARTTVTCLKATGIASMIGANFDTRSVVSVTNIQTFNFSFFYFTQLVKLYLVNVALFLGHKYFDLQDINISFI